jgi:hypothetical protein
MRANTSNTHDVIYIYNNHVICTPSVIVWYLETYFINTNDLQLYRVNKKTRPAF